MTDFQFLKRLCAALMFTLLMVVSWAVGKSAALNRQTNAAIERGYAEYCPTTGYLAWKGECEK